MTSLDAQRAKKTKQFIELLISMPNKLTLQEFAKLIAKSPFYNSKKFSNSHIFIKIWSRTIFYQLEKHIMDLAKNSFNKNIKKIDLYKQLNNIFAQFKKDLYDKLDDQDLYQRSIYNSIKDELDANQVLYSNNIDKAYEKINNLNITDLKDFIYKSIIDEQNSRKSFYIMKMKRWINEVYENKIIEQAEKNSTHEEKVVSLKELKNLNNIGETFGINTNVINEINNSVKDKFIWAEGNLITSEDGYGINHGQMQQAYFQKRRGESISDNYYITNSRAPEDMMIEYTEEESKVPMAFGSYYFNNEVCIIEGRYLIERNDNNYNQLIQQLKKRFTHIFDLTISDKSMKQEAKLAHKIY